MTNQTKAKGVCLITHRTGEIETPSCVVPTFRTAYKIALFEQSISFPNLEERPAIRIMNKNGKVYLWDTNQFQYEDEARWSPLGKMTIIQKIPVKKR